MECRGPGNNELIGGKDIWSVGGQAIMSCHSNPFFIGRVDAPNSLHIVNDKRFLVLFRLAPHYSTSSHVSYVLILLFMNLNYEFAGLELLKLPNTYECREIERARLQLCMMAGLLNVLKQSEHQERSASECSEFSYDAVRRASECSELKAA
jgi:hypothetical protein